jgi:hypothetical protein
MVSTKMRGSGWLLVGRELEPNGKVFPVHSPSIPHNELVAVEAVIHPPWNSCAMLCTVLFSCTGGSCSAPNIEKIHCNLCIACQLFLWRFDT